MNIPLNESHLGRLVHLIVCFGTQDQPVQRGVSLGLERHELGREQRRLERVLAGAQLPLVEHGPVPALLDVLWDVHLHRTDLVLLVAAGHHRLAVFLDVEHDGPALPPPEDAVLVELDVELAV